MPNLLSLNNTSSEQIMDIIQRAEHYQTSTIAHDGREKHLAGKVAANLFFEASTRTLNSFQLAQARLDLIDLSPVMQMSALKKGESEAAMVSNLQAMGVNLFVIRHAADDFFTGLADVHSSARFINAGCGSAAHPTQALIDLMTIYQQKGTFAGLKVVVVGDSRYSRVARSLATALLKFDIKELVFVAPAALQISPIWQDEPVSVTDELYPALTGADVVVALRMQKERFDGNLELSMDDYINHYRLTMKAMAYAKADAIVMHPGPCNVGIEISQEVMHGLQSMILQQVSYSVAIRMAAIDYAFA